MGALVKYGNEKIWKFHAINVTANGVGLISVLDCFRSQPAHWRSLLCEALNLGTNVVFSLVYAFVYHPEYCGHNIGWRGYIIWAVYVPFMFCGSWWWQKSGIGPHSTSNLPVNVEYISERFGLLLIITCGESLFAAAAILAQTESIKKLATAAMCVYYALLLKLLYFELQSHVTKHAMDISHLRGICWTLCHIPIFVCAAGAGASFHWWASSGLEWKVRERNLFLAFTVIELLSLAIVSLFHGKIHIDKQKWWTKKKIRIGVRLIVCLIMILGVLSHDLENIHLLLFVCFLLSVDFGYEFGAKRMIAEEHEHESVVYKSQHPGSARHIAEKGSFGI